MKKKILFLLLAGVLALAGGCVTPDTSSESSLENSAQGGEAHTEHVDADANGICESCGESTLRVFDFYAINDLHGKMIDTDSQPGVDEMTTYLRNAKQNNPNSILLSSGDMWQGSPESNLTKGKMMTDWMNDLGFASMTLGNHEFDWGEDYIEENSKLAQFPFLAINIFDVDTSKRVDYCDASVMIEMDGAKIGIIGAMGDCYSSIASDNTKGVYFVTQNDLTELVKAESDKLRAEGADCIIYSLHDTYQTGYDEALSQGYVDVVFEGHSHSVYEVKDSYGVYHLQSGGDNQYGLARARLEINIATETATTKQTKIVSASQYKNLEDDPIMATLSEKYKAEVEKGYTVLGTNDRLRSSSELSVLAARLYLEAGIKKWADHDIVLAGGSINVRSPYELPAGDVTYGDLLMLFPFDNQLVLCAIKGRDLLDRFIDNERYYVAYTIDPNEVEYNKTYYVVTDTWNSPYASNRLTEIERWEEPVYARDLLAEYVENGGMGTAKPTQPTELQLTSISDIIALGELLANNEETAETYDVKGTVVSIDSGNGLIYGNMTIQDEEGNTLYVYGVNDTAGNRYDSMQNAPQVGDTVVLRGTVKKYQDIVELYKTILLFKNEEINHV